MKENKQDDKKLINNSVNTNIQEFRVAFEFENQKTPLIIELSFDKENKKILPDNKYFDKIYDNLKSKCECDIKQVVLKQWNKYLENKIKGYHAQISECPADNYGDYLILVLFLEMIQRHCAENKLDQKNIWYNVASLQDLSQHFPQSVLDVSSNSQKTVGGEIFNNCADYLKSNLVKIVFIDDFPMEVVPQLFKLQNFCTKPLEVDVTPFNLGKRIDYDENDNKNRTEKVVKEVKKILDIKDDVTDPENSVESNLPKEEAVSKLKFVGQTPITSDDTQISWFQNNFCGFAGDKTVYAEQHFKDTLNGFDPYINIKTYAPLLDPQTVPNSIETVPSETESSSNLNEVNKPESDTVENMHGPHTVELMSVETFKGDSPGLYNSKNKEAPKNESSNEMDGKFKDSDHDINEKKLDYQTVSNSIETVPYKAKPSNNLNKNAEQKPVMMTNPHGKEFISDKNQNEIRKKGEINDQISPDTIKTASLETKSSSNLSENTKTKRFSYETFEEFKSRRLALLTPVELEKLERRKREIDKNQNEIKTKDENRKSLFAPWVFWIALILCGIVFVGAPSGAFLFGALFTLKGGIPVAGVMIFSGIGFGYSINKIKKLWQQNSDISLSSDNKDAGHPKTFIKYNYQEIKSPLLENETKNKGAK